MLTTNVGNTPTSLAASLTTVILDGLHVRFDRLFHNDDFILAAVCHPKFKLSWINDPAEKSRCTRMLESVCESVATDVQSDSENAVNGCRPWSVLRTASFQYNSQCLSYLSNSDRSLDMMSRYPKIKAVFNNNCTAFQCDSGKAY